MEFSNLGHTIITNIAFTGYNHLASYFQKSVFDLDEAINIISDFYNDEDISDGFKPYPGLINTKRQFITNDFIYTVTAKRILQYNLLHGFFGTPFLMYFLYIIMNPKKLSLSEEAFLSSFAFLIWVYFSGINWAVFFNYFRYSKNQCLIISKGKDRFYFGEKDNLVEYSKKDIQKVTILYYYGNKNPYTNNQLFTITFKNGDFIQITGLLIRDTSFYNKISAIKHEYIRTYFPKFVRKKQVPN